MAGWAEGIAGGDGCRRSRSHAGDRRALRVRDSAAMNSGGLWAEVDQNPRGVRIFPIPEIPRHLIPIFLNRPHGAAEHLQGTHPGGSPDRFADSAACRAPRWPTQLPDRAT